MSFCEYDLISEIQHCIICTYVVLKTTYVTIYIILNKLKSAWTLYMATINKMLSNTLYSLKSFTISEYLFFFPCIRNAKHINVLIAKNRVQNIHIIYTCF